MAKDLIADLQKCAPILLDAKFSGVYSVGEFNGGIDKSVDVDTLVDGDCIFVGELPNFALYEGEKPQIETDSQLLVGVFEQQNGGKAYFIVNNSIVVNANVTIKSGCKNVIASGENKRREIASWQTFPPVNISVCIDKIAIIQNGYFIFSCA